jgi:hypothetical protein
VWDSERLNEIFGPVTTVGLLERGNESKHDARSAHAKLNHASMVPRWFERSGDSIGSGEQNGAEIGAKRIAARAQFRRCHGAAGLQWQQHIEPAHGVIEPKQE